MCFGSTLDNPNWPLWNSFDIRYPYLRHSSYLEARKQASKKGLILGRNGIILIYKGYRVIPTITIE